MKQISRNNFTSLLKDAGIKPRLANELRFPALDPDKWPNIELLPVYARDDHRGVLLLPTKEHMTLLPFTIRRRIVDTQTGRLKPVICDFCCTYQKGSNAGTITFAKGTDKSISHLCCADLRCSDHVRTLTAASVYSRTQLHEDLNNAQRIARLQKRLEQLAERCAAL